MGDIYPGDWAAVGRVLGAVFNPPEHEGPPYTHTVTPTEPNECITCGEDVGGENECPTSQRPCGHHCNCSWIHDCCHWCGAQPPEDEEEYQELVVPDHCGVFPNSHVIPHRGCILR